MPSIRAERRAKDKVAMKQRRGKGLAGASIPDARGFIHACSNHSMAIGTEGCVKHAQFMRHWGRQRPARGNLPNPGFAFHVLEIQWPSVDGFTAGGHQGLAVRTERDASDLRAVLQWRREGKSGVRIPNPCRVVFTGGCHKPTVWAEGDPPNFPSML